MSTVSLCLCARPYPNGQKGHQTGSTGKTQKAKLQKATVLTCHREALCACFASLPFSVCVLMLEPFCKLDDKHSSLVQRDITTSTRTLAHILLIPQTGCTKSYVPLNVQDMLPPEGGGATFANISHSYDFPHEVVPWNPKSHFLHACAPSCTRSRERGHEFITQSRELLVQLSAVTNGLQLFN